jgi:outer membrane protein assembly factor BamB
MMGDRVLVLGWNNALDAIGIEDGQPIYSVSITGSSQPQVELPVDVYPMSYSSPGHMAVIGDIVALVLADGSVAAVDGKTGTGLWWTYRTLQGTSDVFTVGSRLVVSIGGTYVLPPDSAPRSTAATPVSSDSPNCGTELSEAPEGANISELTQPDYSGMLYGVDPATGAVAWSGTTELFIGLMDTSLRTSGDSLMLDTTTQYQGTTTPGTWCAVDVDTGRITPLTDPASIALGSFINDVNNGRILETIAIFANGQFVAYPTEQPVDPAMPVVDLSPYLSGSFRWVELYAGAIYVSMGDGTLMKVPLSA